jgi:ubiquinone biosynthesis protein UbiJ
MTVAVPTSVEIDDLEDCLAATEDAVAYLKRKLERLRKGVN